MKLSESEKQDSLCDVLFKTRHPNHEAYEREWGDYYHVEKVLALVLILPIIIGIIVTCVYIIWEQITDCWYIY